MKIIYTLFFATILIFTSCINDYDNGKENPISQSHEYGNGDGENSDLESAINTRENPDRNNWQKPREVIRRLGNLEGKVVADVGAGAGYFSFQFLRTAEKVIAIDIDANSIAFIDSVANNIRKDWRGKLETRLVPEDNPSLNTQEADIVFISNTYAYLSNKVEYLKALYKGMKPNGRICIVDFKMKKLPRVLPPVEYRIPLFEVENHLEEAGFKHLFSDDQTLDYQYIVIAEKGAE